MNEKEQILREIKRLAKENDGRPPGVQAFTTATGIPQHDWYPNIWLRWGDALEEAGYQRNTLRERISDDLVTERYVSLIRELGRIPVAGEIKRKARSDKSFPSHSIFGRVGKAKLIEAAMLYSQGKPDLRDVYALCFEAHENTGVLPEIGFEAHDDEIGYVYLMKSGRHFKIGRTSSPNRRDRELAITIPIPPKTIHSIKTDDPSGVEAYWHRRFADRRGEGEWFELTPADVAAFKRWKRIF